MQLFLLVVLLAATASTLTDDANKILVRSDCGNCTKVMNSSHCCSLYWALQKLQQVKSSVQVAFCDMNTTYNASVTLTELHNVTFVSNSGGPAMIYCEPGAGVSFVNSTGIFLDKIYFNNCGHTTSYRGLANSSVAKWPCALLFHSCGDIQLQGTILNNSRGSGLIMINPFRDVKLIDTYYSLNVFNNTDTDYPGGGGILLFFNGSQDAYSSNYRSHILLNASIFSSNSVRGRGIKNAKPAGGALAIIFGPNSGYNRVELVDSYFNGNKALLGGGLYIKLEGESRNNTVYAYNLNLFGHNCYSQNDIASRTSPEQLCIGGAISVQFLLHKTSLMAANNTVFFNFSLISKNIAFAGGAISVVATRQASEVAKTNSLVLDKMKMTFNRAQVGSTIHFSSEPGPSEGYLLTTVIEDLQASQNFITNKSNVTVGQGALYINQLPVKFKRQNAIKQCQGTALVITQAQVSLLENSSITFDSNQGKLGGALALLNGASLIVHKNTQVEFKNNKANEKGGAVYISNHYDTYEYPMSGHQCAISYFDRAVPPSEWETKFIFNQNYAGLKKSAIFATSVLSCPTQTTDPGNNKSLPFCWKNWKYEEQENAGCSYLLTSPATIRIHHINSEKLVHTTPGFPLSLPILLIDDYNQDVTNKSVLTAFIVKGNATIDLSSQYIAGGNITVYGEPNTTATLAVETAEPRVIYTELELRFGYCPPGFYHVRRGKHNGYTCTCEVLAGRNIICSRETLSAKIFYKWCMTYDEKQNKIVMGNWIYYIQLNFHHDSGYVKLPHSVYELDAKFCYPLNRTGRLCGECRNGTGVSVSSILFECVDCKSSDFPWHFILYLIIELVPVTIFFLIVVFFNISITTGPATSFVFFSQMITLPMEIFHFQDIFTRVLGPAGKVVLNILIVPYSIWNLDFFKTIIPPFCLHTSLKTMHVIALSYVRAFYPLVLVIACYFLIEMYARGWKAIVCICRPFSLLLGRFRRNWQIRTSVIDAFATFLVLAYTKLCSTSFFLLVPNVIYNSTGGVYNLQLLYMDASVEYQSSEHLWCMIFALCVVTLIVIPLPLVLFFYPLKIVQKVLQRFHMRNNNIVAFMDSFQGCYKDGTNNTRDLRPFSAVYFLFRIIILAITMLSNDQIKERTLQLICGMILILLLVTLRPYKNNIYTNLDVFIMSLMVYISAYSIAHANTVRKMEYLSVPLFLALLIPLVYMTVYTTYHFLLKCKQNKVKYSEHSLLTPQSTGYDPIIPDRILHPENYDSHSRNNEQVPLLHKVAND